ncbi:MAG: RagB/SusD family nutrient uptake outer membrane protein [Bacteroidota bacterium]
MKNNFVQRFAAFALLIVVIISCSKEFLDTKPYGSVNNELLATSAKGANSLLIAAYSNLDGFSGWDNGTPWGGAASNWTFGSITGGDAYKGSEAGDQPDITPLEIHKVDANNPYLEAKWRNYYDGISRVNGAIKAFNSLKQISASEKTIRISEAKFLRAFFHFDLWRIFRNIPYIDETLEDVRIGNSTDILPKIQADLIAAIAGLPVTQPEAGRSTKGAAQSLLGHTYMWQKKYSDAKTQFDAVIASGRYKLNAKYHDNFNASTRNTKEGVLEVQQSVNDGTTDNGNNGDVLNFPYNGGPAGCCGFHQPSQDLVNAFQTDANGLPLLDNYSKTDVTNDDGLASAAAFTPHTGNLDPRLDWTVGRRGIPYLDWGNHPGANWIRDNTYGGPYAPIKNVHYKAQEGSLVTSSGWTSGYNANNLKLIRYSDVLLMAAEAEVELGNLERARTLVNQVRERAANPDGFVKSNGQPAANYVISTYKSAWTDASTARKAVRFERRIELGMEGHRFFDLVRWGEAAAVKNAYFAKEKTKRTYLSGASFVAGKHEIFPIPQKAITQSSKAGAATLKQNPGY